MLTLLLPQLPAGQYHKVHTVSPEPSCYMYLYVNTTALELEQNLTRLWELRERARNGTGEGGGTPNTQYLIPGDPRTPDTSHLGISKSLTPCFLGPQNPYHLTPWAALGAPKRSITSAPGEQLAEEIMEVAVTGVGGTAGPPNLSPHSLVSSRLGG